jgi:hypothetical protein
MLGKAFSGESGRKCQRSARKWRGQHAIHPTPSDQACSCIFRDHGRSIAKFMHGSYDLAGRGRGRLSMVMT